MRMRLLWRSPYALHMFEILKKKKCGRFQSKEELITLLNTRKSNRMSRQILKIDRKKKGLNLLFQQGLGIVF